MITPRDVDVLRALARYYVLNRAQIQRLTFPTDRDGRITRRRLTMLQHMGLIQRTQVHVISPLAGIPSPVYFPSRSGCDMLAELCDDEHYLLTPTRPPLSHRLFHWLAVSETHIALDQAMTRSEAHCVECVEFVNEWDIVNKDETDPAQRFRLYTRVQDAPRLVCAPDAAFLLETAGNAMVFYLEQDRATTGVQQAAARKSPGYAAMFAQRLHRRHFPRTTLDRFAILMVAPTPRRRDALKKAFASKDEAQLWRFASCDEIRAETFLFAPIWHKCDGGTAPLIKPPTEAENAA